MISAIAWVPRGVAKSKPEPAEPSEEELAAMQAGTAGAALLAAWLRRCSSLRHTEHGIRACSTAPRNTSSCVLRHARAFPMHVP